MIYIYCLKDPRFPDIIKYIGKTNNTKQRLADHKCRWKVKKGKLSKLNSWIKHLAKQGIIPIMEEIDHCLETEWEKYETGYVLLLKSCGANLKNGTNGGKTHAKNTKSKKALEKKKVTMKGRKRPEQSRIMKELHKEGRYANFGLKNLSEEEKDRINKIKSETAIKSHKEGKFDKNKKKIIKLCLKTGEETSYESVVKAASDNNVNTRYVWQCLTNDYKGLGKRKGFIFKEATKQKSCRR